MKLTRLLPALLLATALLAIPAAAQPLPDPDRRAIQDVITRQLDAFRHDDAEAAYALAAPAIQQLFPTPGAFMEMVRRGYPQVYRPRQQEFSELTLQDGNPVQEVELVGPDGRPVLALYTMERGPDGIWRIAACTLLPSVRVGA